MKFIGKTGGRFARSRELSLCATKPVYLKGKPDFHEEAYAMIAVIFEVVPKVGRAADYFDEAAKLKPLLETMDGFISVERFESLTKPGKFLSLSFWRDGEAVKAWRNSPDHRHTQAKGRARIFEDYRLRVAGVIRDYGMMERDEAPDDSRRVHAR
jgi:heme-degrading monooxygenase HmoA